MIQLTIPKKMAAKHCWWCTHVLSHFPSRIGLILNWINTVQSDLSSEVLYICGHMIFPRAAQQVGRTDFNRRILLFRRWIRGWIESFFLLSFCFENYILIIRLPVREWFKKSAFKKEKLWRFDSEVSNSRCHDSILFFLLGRVYRWGY